MSVPSCEAKERVVDWLKDAYAMERGLEVMLRTQAENEEVHRAVCERARIHLDETYRLVKLTGLR